MEDLQSALKGRNLTVSTIADKGRCLLATRDFNPGEVIISQEPYVCVPNKSSAETRCDGCFTTSKLKKCSGCQVVWYCGSTCQKSEWKLHRLECEVLSRLDKERRKSVTPSIRLMVKLYLRRKLQSERIIPSTATDNYNLVEALVAHMSDINEEQLVLYAQMANLVNLILQWPEINVREIAENFSKFACNAHTICDSELRPLGTGLYPVISIINHSCLPNSVLVFEGRSAVVRAVEHIPKGSEVLISYIETAGSTMTRQKALKEQYLFTCTCPRCVKVGQYDDIQESAILERYRCKNEKCCGFLVRTTDGKGFQCQECGLVRDMEEIKKIATEVKSLSEDKAPKICSTGNYQEAITVYKMIEKFQSELCHPFSISLMQTREKLLKLLMELKHWREALAYCKLTLPVYQMDGYYIFLLCKTTDVRYYGGKANVNYKEPTLVITFVTRIICMKELKNANILDSGRTMMDSKMSKADTQKHGVYPAVHPLLGLQYYSCGKLEWYLGDTEGAVKSLTKAVDVLRITHGTNTPFMKELLMKLEEARAEASYQQSSKDE